MKTLIWTFDFISPYSYLQHEVLERVRAHARVLPRPVLFAGLLEHHAHKGPAEIAPKKIHTFREVIWRAHQHGIPLTLPPAHPFNPLPLLRLCLALDNQPRVIERLFHFVWREGRLPDDRPAFEGLCRELGLEDPARIDAPEIKQALRRNTQAAIDEGLFGVPSLQLDAEVYWGFDMTDAVIARLEGHPVFDSELMHRAATLPDGVRRLARDSRS
ncbi:MAG: 2-hydroxychromene-2-carboxylate isomerase [Burkholderiaceae bacterium]